MADAGVIDFSIETVDLDSSGIVLEEGGCEGGVARHEDALSILENADTRGQFLDEIIEVSESHQNIACADYNTKITIISFYSWKAS